MRIVVKIGTSTLAHSGGRLNIRRVELLCKILSDLKNAGHALVLVTSGAIGMGVGKLGLPGRPQDMPGKQAAAAVGQCELMYFYDKLFSEYHHTVAQILLTAEDVRDPRRSAHLHDTLERLLSYGALPIVNENDAVATDEIGIETTIGENDTLSAIVAQLVEADLLILLSDIDGLYTADPHKNPDARLIPVVEAVTDKLGRWPEAPGRRWPRAAWPPSSRPPKSPAARAWTWSSPTARSPSSYTTSSTASPSAPDF